MASIASKTLAVNAAFLQEIKDDHHEIRELLASARALAHEAQPSIAELTDALTRLRDQLSFHFALEEAYGYYDGELNDQAPWLCDQATRLREEHIELFVEMGDCVNEAEGLRYEESPPKQLSQLCHKVVAFCNWFVEHERRETELILRVFDDDVGVGD